MVSTGTPVRALVADGSKFATALESAARSKPEFCEIQRCLTSTLSTLHATSAWAPGAVAIQSSHFDAVMLSREPTYVERPMVSAPRRFCGVRNSEYWRASSTGDCHVSRKSAPKEIKASA